MAVKTVNKFDHRRSMKISICTGLALVLLAVLFRAFGNTPSSVAAGPVVNRSAIPSGSGNARPSSVRAIEIEIPDVLPRDPFDGTTAFPVKVPASTKPITPEVKSPSVADERAAIAAEARSTIVLEATTLGAVPTALINGKHCRVGQVVKGFTVKQIAADHVVIERDGVALRVSYARPDNGRD